MDGGNSRRNSPYRPAFASSMRCAMKKILSLVFVFIFAVLLCVPFYAEAGADDIALIDIADGILSDDEYGEICVMATNTASEIEAAVGIIFTNSSLSQNQLMKRADKLFDESCDIDGDGIILAVDVKSRQYYIRQIGKMNRLYSSSMDEIEDAALSGLRESDWYTAAKNFISAVGENADYYTPGPDDTCPDDGKLIYDTKQFEIIVAIVAIVIALISVGVMAGRMNNAKPKRSAENYIKKDSFILNLKTDMFLYSTVSKVKIESDSSRSGGGGGGGGGGGRGGRGGSF